MAVIEQQREEMARYRKQMAALTAWKGEKEEENAHTRAKLPKHNLQKLSPVDDIEHFLSTFELMLVDT